MGRLARRRLFLFGGPGCAVAICLGEMGRLIFDFVSLLSNRARIVMPPGRERGRASGRRK
jgi:hypothetical protein